MKNHKTLFDCWIWYWTRLFCWVTGTWEFLPPVEKLSSVIQFYDSISSVITNFGNIKKFRTVFRHALLKYILAQAHPYIMFTTLVYSIYKYYYVILVHSRMLCKKLWNFLSCLVGCKIECLFSVFLRNRLLLATLTQNW